MRKKGVRILKRRVARTRTSRFSLKRLKAAIAREVNLELGGVGPGPVGAWDDWPELKIPWIDIKPPKGSIVIRSSALRGLKKRTK
jgi:hypothetical protein